MAKTSEGGAAGKGPVVTGTTDFGTANGQKIIAVAYSDGTVHLTVGGQDIAVETGTLTPAGTGDRAGSAATINLADGRKVFLGSFRGQPAIVAAGAQGENIAHVADVPSAAQQATQAGAGPTVQQQQAASAPAKTTPTASSGAGGAGGAATPMFGSGGGGGGSSTTIINQAPSSPSMTTATTYNVKELESQYGYAAQFFASNPELTRLLNEAVKNQWTPQEFAGRLQGTKWFRTHTASQQKYIQLKTSNPAEFSSQIAQIRVGIQNQALKNGVTISDQRLNAMADDALKFGWTTDQVSAAIASEFKYTGQGAASPIVDGLKEEASKYFVPLSDQTLQTWAQHFIAGTADQNTFDAYLKEQAKSLFPGLSAAIDAGVTPQTYTDPYKNIAANVLGVNPNDVNFMDPKWSKALFQVDPKTGARTSMSLSDWQKTLMTDPTYNYAGSQNGQKAQFDIAQQIEKIMGSPVATTA